MGGPRLAECRVVPETAAAAAAAAAAAVAAATAAAAICGNGGHMMDILRNPTQQQRYQDSRRVRHGRTHWYRAR